MCTRSVKTRKFLYHWVLASPRVALAIDHLVLLVSWRNRIAIDILVFVPVSRKWFRLLQG